HTVRACSVHGGVEGLYLTRGIDVPRKEDHAAELLAPEGAFDSAGERVSGEPCDDHAPRGGAEIARTHQILGAGRTETLFGSVGHTARHIPHPIQCRGSIYTRPASSCSMAVSETGQASTQREQS